MSVVRRHLEMTVDLIRQGMPSPSSRPYINVADYVLQRGRLLDSKALTPAERAVVAVVAGRVKRKGFRFELKQCYTNALRLVLMAQKHPSAADWHYVEGYATSTIIPTNHAWVLYRGKVIDFTWRPGGWDSTPDLQNRVWGEIPEGWEYYGVTFDPKSLKSVPVIDDWEADWPVLRGEDPQPVG